MRQKFVVTVLVLLLVGIVTASCSSHSIKKVVLKKTTTTTSLASLKCPLTDTSAPGNLVPMRPALAIKVDNYPTARPQAGLNQADVVFDEPVEGFITRFVAVFQCQTPPLVGPIRSARLIDVAILDELSDPIFIHAGGIQQVIDALKAANAYDDNIFWHGSIEINPPGRQAPYDTYTSTTNAWALQPSDTTPPEPLFNFGPINKSASSVSSININFSPTNDTTWTWDAALKKFELSYKGVVALDSLGLPLVANNVLVERVSVTFGPWWENSQGGLEVVADMTGTGQASLFRDGEVVNGTWQRSSLASPTTYVDNSGGSMNFTPGNTWVEIVPNQVSTSVNP